MSSPGGHQPSENQLPGNGGVPPNGGQQPGGPPTGDQPPHSVRLIFEYEGDDVRLISTQWVDMMVSGFDLQREQLAGHFVEVRGGDDQTLSRVPVRDAMTGSREVFPEQAGEPITRVDAPAEKGAFTVVVPVTGAADHLSVVRMSRGDPQLTGVQSRATSAVPDAGQTTEIARFPLRLDDGGGQPA